MKTYKEAECFLLDRLNFERIPARHGELHLERMLRLLGRLGNPHRFAPVIHLAGTKGKGSTAGLLSQVLHASGRRVGLYTSPHLSRIEERLQVNNRPCSPDDLVRLTSSIADMVRTMDDAGDSPTFFELSTALAMLHFRDQSVEVAVLETGLGGRLDSTNVCDPMVSIITSISLDHTRQLGDTVEKIAVEKCGIIKPLRPVISGVTPHGAAAVVEQTALDRRCELSRLGHEIHLDNVRLVTAPSPATQFDFRSQQRSLQDLRIGLLGVHQARNAALALAALEVVERTTDGKLYTHNEPILRDALAQARLPARIEQTGESPLTLVDVAHNVASAEALIEVIEQCYPRLDAAGSEAREVHPFRRLVLSISRDKNAPAIVRVLLPHFDDIVLTRFLTNPRAITPEELHKQAQRLLIDLPEHAPTLQVIDTPLEAWNHARDNASSTDLICVTGSFFLAAELRDTMLAASERS